MINGDTYNEKDAVLGYVASMKNKTDLMSGDHSYFTPPFDGELSKTAHALEEARGYFDDYAFTQPYWKKEEGERVIRLTTVYHKELLEAVNKYAPEIVPKLQNNLSSYTSPYVIDLKKEANNIRYYLNTTEYRHDITSGDFDYIPKSLEKKYKEFEKINDKYLQTRDDLGKRELDSLGRKVINSRNAFFNALREEYEKYQKNNRDTAPSKTPLNVTPKETDRIIGKIKNNVSDLFQKDKVVKSDPLLFYTVNGDRVEAKIQKEHGSWCLRASINSYPFVEWLDKKDLKKDRQTLKDNPLKLIEKYFPKQAMQKVAAEKFMLPLYIDIGTGKKEILHRLSIETMMEQDHPLYHKKVATIQVGKKKMELPVSRIDLEDYDNKLISTHDLISKLISNSVTESVKNINSVKGNENTLGFDKKTKMEEQPNKQPEKKQPQMITVNGDEITHAHVFKSNKSDDWFFTAKINGIPLKPQKVSNEDMEAVVVNKSKKPQELMETYYPTKMMAKVPAEEFKRPFSVNTPDGEKPVYKFNVYKVDDKNNLYHGKYRFYAQVGDMKMSENASKKDLDAYFDRVEKPANLIKKVFGERLHLAEYYQMFKLPEAANIESKDIRLTKNPISNRYEISVNLGDHGTTSKKEISYDDRQSYFTHKTASKDQLAAKYLGGEINDMLKATPKQAVGKQHSLSM